MKGTFERVYELNKPVNVRSTNEYELFLCEASGTGEWDRRSAAAKHCVLGLAHFHNICILFIEMKWKLKRDRLNYRTRPMNTMNEYLFSSHPHSF